MTRERTIKLQIMLDDIELDVIDSWRFLKGMPSRQAAMRELIHRGLPDESFKSAHMNGVLEMQRGVR
jgi:hypothetical protein